MLLIVSIVATFLSSFDWAAGAFLLSGATGYLAARLCAVRSIPSQRRPAVDPGAASIWQAYRRLDERGRARVYGEIIGVGGQLRVAAFVFPVVVGYFVCWFLVVEGHFAVGAWTAVAAVCLTAGGLRAMWDFWNDVLLGRREPTGALGRWTGVVLAVLAAAACAWIGWLSVSAGATAQTSVTGVALLGCLGSVVWVLGHRGSEAQRTE